MTAAEIAYDQSFKAGLKPNDFISVSEWADKYRIIPKAGGAKEPGKWRTSRFPFTKEPMDNLSPFSGVQITIIMAGTQIAKTECGHNFFGHTVHIAPAPMMILLPTIEVAKRRAKTKIKHTIEQTPVLKARIAPIRERDSDNTTLFRTFLGGSLIISGANSAASLRDISIKNLHLDEVDAYDLDLEKEGDTISLALKRTDSFGDEKRVLITSTPTLKEFSKIEREFDNSDQRHYYIPCPFCNHMQYLRWKDGRWNGDGEYRLVFEYDKKYQLISPVTYKCEACEELIPEHHKTWMFSQGQWRPHNPGHRRRGYKLPSLYSPLGFLSWAEIVQEFLDARHEKDAEKLKTWKNTRLAETWDDERDQILEHDNNLFLARRENYGPVVPMAALALVAGADVQRDRIEINVAAFGQGEEWWNMEYTVIPGSIGDKHVQKSLDDYLFAPWLHASGAEMTIARTLIDSGDGVNSQEIYDYVRLRQRRGVIATKGSKYAKKPIVERSKKVNQGGIRHYNIGTDTAKDSIYNTRLSMTPAKQVETEFYKLLTDQEIEVSPLYVHWNMAGYDEEYFLQLMAEVIKKEKKGRRYVRYYKQIRERNEAIDTAVLCLAGLRILRPNWKMLVERLAKAAEKAKKDGFILPAPTVCQSETASEKIDRQDHKPQPTAPFRGRRVISRGQDGWIDAWR